MTTTSTHDYAPIEIDRHVNIGLFVIVAGFLAVLVWAAFAPLAGAVVAPGQLAPEGNHKTIQHLEGGLVRAVRVKEGDVVRAGDVLIELDSVATRSRAEQLRQQVDSLSATEARLLAEEKNQATVRFPEDLMRRQSEPGVADILQGQREIFRSRAEARRMRIAAANGEIEQLKEQIRGLEAQQTASTAQLASIEEELKGLKRLFKEGFGWESRIRAFEREAEKLQGDAARAGADKAAAFARIQKTRADMVRTEQELVESTAGQRQETLRQLHEAEQQLQAVSDGLARLAITAPYQGRVLNLKKNAVGGVVAPGEALMDIVPLDERLIADVRINPQDVDQVEAGQKAEVLFPTLNKRQTPVLAGEVIMVSADRLVDSATNQPYYLARVMITETTHHKIGPGALRAGVPVEVHVQTGARSALSYILKPLIDSIRRGMTET
ncbi:MAG TPA: HlyD family type I secretion periplasmic adaptor subunit [Burkholderiales bacterium]|nr:HlyD family type I secretion periplasmic adaptor subunit [Burkholderiales bacterium]